MGCCVGCCVIMCENSISIVKHVFSDIFPSLNHKFIFFRSLPDTQIVVVSMNGVGWRAVLFVLSNLIFEIDYSFV